MGDRRAPLGKVVGEGLTEKASLEQTSEGGEKMKK